MTVVHAEIALTPQGWRQDVRLTIEAGRFAGVESGAVARSSDERCGLAIPGLPNVHSHAFQRAMAGLAETRGPSTDTFWTWRETMYRFALRMTRDEFEAVASMVYVEMLEAGFTRVGEFHYLHHDRDGRPYAAPAEMALRIAAAAGRSGIRLTLLPCFYAHSTFGGAPPRDEQRRFICAIDQFARLMEASRTAIKPLPGSVLGLAPHSLRAVTPAELAALLELSRDGPVHIHAAEQVNEVKDCLLSLKARPVEFLLDNAPVGPRWCFIHATHMTEAETERLALTGAIAGLCPVTEANLGDGIFNAPTFIAKAGRYGIGTDSNVLIGVADELRQLEYAQRLAHRERNIMGRPDCSTGRALIDDALEGGGAALGAPIALAPGAPADFLSLNLDHPSSEGLGGDGVLDAWLFVERDLVDCVWVGGVKLVEGGRHLARETIETRFRRAMKTLRAS
jgi:formimidoylglutamate deiminase